MLAGEHPSQMESKPTIESPLAAPAGSTFSFEFQGHASRLRTGGDVAFDMERKQWRATIIAQRDPELRFDAWDDDPAIASLMVCAKWMGRDMSNAELCHGSEPLASAIGSAAGRK